MSDEKPVRKPGPKKPHRGMFPPKTSGNPGGRPKGVAEVQEAARAHTAMGIEELAAIAKLWRRDAKQTRASVAAIDVLLERGWGKAVQPIDLTPPENNPLRAAFMLAVAAFNEPKKIGET